MKIKHPIIPLLLFSVSFCTLNALTYTTSVGVSNTGISASTEPDGNGDGAGLLWEINPGNLLEPWTYTVGIGHVWYEVSSNTIIDPSFTLSGTEFANAFTANTGGSISMIVDTPFYLGFWLDANEDSFAGADDRYGWAALEYDGVNLSLLSNGISDSGSIQVGVIPELSTYTLIMGACMFILVFNRRSKK